jgi:phosphate-selective porin OprO/OprP
MKSAAVLLAVAATRASADPVIDDSQPPSDPGPAENPTNVGRAAPPEAARSTIEPRPADVPPPPQAPILDAAAIDRIVDARIASIPSTAGWDENGFFVQTRDGGTKLTIGGYTQFDGRFFVAEGNDPKIDQFGFKSIRPDLGGTVLDHYDFRLLPDFAGSKLVIQDAWVDVRYTDAAIIRFGKSKTGFGLERMQREFATTFVERGQPSSLTPNRDLGVSVHGELAGGLVAYSVGLFNGVPDGGSGDGDVSNGKEGIAALQVKPLVHTDSLGKELAIGAGASYGDRTGTIAQPDTAQYKTQGQTTFFAYKTGTTLMDTVIADGIQWRATANADWYAGPFGALAEYVRSTQHVALDGTHTEVTAEAWQVLAQWVLTGDAATYKSVAPVYPFDPVKGHWGAFDVAARVGELRFANSAAFDAKVADPTKSALRAWSAGAGVDWFPNRTFRFVLDLERTWFRLGAKGDTGAVDRVPETSIIGRAQTVF